jgi:hypothetical protein
MIQGIAVTVVNADPAEPCIDVTVSVSGPLDLGRTLQPHRRGLGDPTFRLEPGRALRATRTADGPASLLIERTADGVRVQAWGPGAPSAIGGVPMLVGIGDDQRVLAEAPHRLVRELARRFAGLRIGRTGAVWEALWPAIVEQKVTGNQARRGIRGIVSVYGEPAPGPLGLRLYPRAESLAGVPYHAFHPFGIERRRADTLRRAARLVARLESLAGSSPEAVTAALLAIPGIGRWTAAEVTARALGDPDAVSVGDYHLPHLVSWALAGEPRGTDERMLELLEPYRGQRGRVIRLLEASGLRPPAYGPRLAPRRIERD